MKHLRCILAVAVIAAALPSTVHAKGLSSELSPEARTAFVAGQTALARHDLLAARAAFERVVALAPEFPAVYHLYALSLGGAAGPVDRDALAAPFRRAMEANPERTISAYADGILDTDATRRHAALGRVIALEPVSPWGYFGEGRLAREEKRFPEALALFEKAHALAPAEPAVTGALVEAYARAGRLDEARVLAEGLAKSAPESFDADYAYFTIIGDSSPTEQLATMKRYVELFPSGWAAGTSYLMVIQSMPRADRAARAAAARAAIGKLRGREEGYDRSRLLDYVFQSIRDDPGAIDALANEMLASDEDSPWVFLAIGNEYPCDTCDPAIAVRVAERALELKPRAIEGGQGAPWLGDKLREALENAKRRAAAAAAKPLPRSR